MSEFWELLKRFRLLYKNGNIERCKDIIKECNDKYAGNNDSRIKLLEKMESILDGRDNDFNFKFEEDEFSKRYNTYSFVTSIFNRFWQLKTTLPKNLNVLRQFENVDLVIVDFGGEDSADIENFIESNFSFDLLSGKLKYYKITKSWTKFHMAPAKNAAARLSKGDIIVSLDADNFITATDVEQFQQIPDKKCIIHQTTGPAPMLHSDWLRYELFEEANTHSDKLTWDGSCGRIACSRELFEAINGYNENFVGMGMDDIDFLIRAIKFGANYCHSTMNRNPDSIFIDNGSAQDEHEHEDNQINWKLMDKGIESGSLSAKYTTSVPVSLFKSYVPKCVKASELSEVTLFSSIFNATDYIERFEQDLSDILEANISVCVLLMDVVGSHDVNISERLKSLTNLNENVFYLPINADPGLYECWNVAIRNIKSEYIANLNVDDIRGKNWLGSCLSNLRANLCDVSSPITVPFSDPKINCYGDFTSTIQSDEAFEKWFDCSMVYDFYSGDKEWRSLTAGYYDHTDMFQVVGDKKIASYCIPNASTVWRKKIHEKIGYFNEKEYGSYTDLVFWMEASKKGFVFKQNNHLALFYLSENQAHMRQDSNYNTLLKLVRKYGNKDYKLLATCNQFDLSLNEGSYGNHHLLGWNWVRDNIHNKLTHNPQGTYLDLFIERTFFWNQGDPDRTFVYNKPWIAFVHTTPHKSSSYDLEAQNLDSLLKEPRFIQSLGCCYGLVVLSQENATYLKKELKNLGYPNIPVITTFHPNIPISSANREQKLSGKVYHIGWHLRSFSAFAKLNIPKENKVLLIPGNLGKEYFLTEVVNKELAENNLGNIEQYVGDMYTADNDEYQDILTNQIVFNSYIQPAGSNLISECISAGTCLVINRHPGFESYLGTDYPLFYDNLEQAEKLIKQIVEEPRQRDLVVQHHDVKNDDFSISSFVSELANILQVLIR